MQTFGFHILAYQGQDTKTQGQLLGRCHIVFCVIEGWTRELCCSTSICPLADSVKTVAFSYTTRGIKGQDHFQGVREIPRDTDTSQPQWQPGILFQRQLDRFKFLSFVMASSAGISFSRKLSFLNLFVA